ncbi:MAG: (2Fe-2S)-binding protein [Paraburkholderia fungorum]|uniref:(2Fe-2S)-binding protein n=1 Tax=Paraburkholderia agricolaris TaxID=2152888 RepID=A0ABW8ZZ25_9BURK|nr:(2Fe-2S)-binding protein [Paraburkholderia agricolaris]MDE1012419.1 (2Fe-2S)-binding protein [Paraburkholderia fungorum]
MGTRFKVNGRSVDVNADEAMPLLWVIRDRLGLTGTKFGCGIAQCGACTVHMNGAAVRSCVVPLAAAAGANVKTIEALSPDRSHPVQKAWESCAVPQCGYCQSGMVMAVAALLESNPDPSREEVDASITNICRCGTYQRIRDAIQVAVKNARHG